MGPECSADKKIGRYCEKYDLSRPVTAACNGTDDNNPLFKSEALDMIGFNYHEKNLLISQNAIPKHRL